ncbi:tetratricopeptide repeat protein [Tritonibacter horizontis]|uniref:Tetratricopeptide repeat protein n=1 Tax=Tritonibacter horizontis TaxID=1768241 RepID=A0A132BV82_9RHOB|nr:tetratricopeptide repeat protein [Tritonibacter horizontis]KUP92106.1 tetratricopeptide repeat protein [Tritonibacter horizontis]
MGAPCTNLKAIVAAIATVILVTLPLGAVAQDLSATDFSDLSEAELLAQLEAGDPDQAAALDRELQALWSKSGSAAMDLLLRRGRDAMARRDWGAALDHLTALTDHAPEFSEGWSERAQAQFHADRFGPAVADLERALALNPNDYNAIFALGQVFEYFDDPDRAYAAYARAKAIHPHHEEVTKALDRLSITVDGTSL